MRLILLFLVFVGCTNPTKIPQDIIPKRKMENILWDIILAERYAGQYIQSDTSKILKTETFKLYDQVFQIHKITGDQFKKSYRYYLGRPDISKVMFDSIYARAERERVRVNKPANVK